MGKDPLDSDVAGFSNAELGTHALNHKHTGIHGDGQKIAAGNLDTSVPFENGLEPIYNAPSGNRYRIQIIEVLDENSVLQPVIQIVPVA